MCKQLSMTSSSTYQKQLENIPTYQYISLQLFVAAIAGKYLSTGN